MLLSEAQAAQSERLTASYKAQQNRDAAKIAALIALYYQKRVNPESAASVEAWLDLMVPKLVAASDSGALKAAAYFDGLRALETSGVNAPNYRATPSLGFIDDGVRKSLLAVGPYEYVNKARAINLLSDISPNQHRALLLEAKGQTTANLASAAVRHVQAGGRQTVHENALLDQVALGWVRVTKASPCAFCAMLASRGVHYRAFKESSFDLSDQRFTGTGDAKVHDSCGCSLKPVYSRNDPLVGKTKVFEDMWSMWGAGGGDGVLRFRRGYDHFQATGEYLTHAEVAA